MGCVWDQQGEKDPAGRDLEQGMLLTFLVSPHTCLGAGWVLRASAEEKSQLWGEPWKSHLQTSPKLNQLIELSAELYLNTDPIN